MTLRSRLARLECVRFDKAGPFLVCVDEQGTVLNGSGAARPWFGKHRSELPDDSETILVGIDPARQNANGPASHSDEARPFVYRIDHFFVLRPVTGRFT